MKHLQNYLLVLALLLASPALLAAKLPGPLVDTAWLNLNLDKVVILDARKDVKSFTAKPVFKKNKKTGKLILARVGGHIPGARLVNYKNLRSKKTLNGQKLVKMLLSKADFEKLMRSAGVNKGDAIVIISKGVTNLDATIATRLYWSLKYYGHDNMAILDGGMAQWLKDGGKVSSDPSKPSGGNWVASAERKEILATTADVKNAVKDKSVQLVDTRPVAQYLGNYRKKSYVFKDGHIPGAKNLPNELFTGPNGKAKFTSKDNIVKLSKALGIDKDANIITYCNSGHLATGGWFFYSEILGNKNVKMYDGSMHEWTSNKGDTVTFTVE